MPKEILDQLDSADPFDSFNITMMEEQLKINDRAKDLGYRTPSQCLDEEVKETFDNQDELIPCKFLQYVSNGVRDDLEQFAF